MVDVILVDGVVGRGGEINISDDDEEVDGDGLAGTGVETNLRLLLSAFGGEAGSGGRTLRLRIALGSIVSGIK